MKKLVTAGTAPSDDESASEQVVMQQDNLLWLQTAINMENRSFELTGVVDDGMVSFTLRCLTKLTEMSLDPITIYLNSPGGSVTDGFAIYDLITGCPCQIIIVAMGQVGSMAPIIMLAGDIRHALPNTYFMVHSPSFTGERAKTVDHHMDDAMDGIYWKKEMLKILAKKTKKDYKFWEQKITKQDYNFNLQQAREYGIVNSVVTTTVSKKSKAKRRKK